MTKINLAMDNAAWIIGEFRNELNNMISRVMVTWKYILIIKKYDDLVALHINAYFSKNDFKL